MLPPTKVSLRLKAARWLAGGLGEDGKPKALPVEELVSRLARTGNRISQNRIEEMEQARVEEPRSMELEKIADALGLPHWWFSDEEPEGLLNEGAEAAEPLPMVSLRNELGAELGEVRAALAEQQSLIETVLRNQEGKG